MTLPQPKEKLVVIHPTDANGEEVKYSAIIALSKPVDNEAIGLRLAEAIMVPGIDSFNLRIGMYSFSVTIARTFDPNEVLTELKRRLVEDVLSDIVRPKLVTPV